MRTIAFVVLVGCSSSASVTVDAAVPDAAVDADRSCPEAEPTAGSSCVAERSCTYRCGCGWLSTATCRDGVWKNSYCPPPEEICRDGGSD